jgi:FkbM family methyltransferase
MPTTKIGKQTVIYDNGEEFHHLKNELFSQHTYYFESDTPSPYIIDAGAHIGLATLYFKKLYPAAQIVAIEPNPDSFELLEQNIWENGLEKVTTVQAALSDSKGKQEFFRDVSGHKWWSTAGFIKGSWQESQESEALIVPTVPLSEYLTQTVDFLKMDIEGAELVVLEVAGPLLRNIKHLILEYHPHAGQSLEVLSRLLENHGFKLTYFKKGQELRSIKLARGLVQVEAVRR